MKQTLLLKYKQWNSVQQSKHDKNNKDEDDSLSEFLDKCLL